ncbi:MAG: DUF4974 domain-containing protein [Bacteroidetes bacterium]|nr:DUF4974 domain-containing protein [Bacteroidota bacterium]
MTKHDQYDNLIAQYLTGEISPAEKSELMTWVEASTANREYFDHMQALWGAAEPPATEFFEKNWESSWDKVEEAIQPVAKVRRLRGRFFRMQLAAVLLIGIGLSFWYFFLQEGEPEWKTIQTASAEKTEVLLPDSSRVWLNANSQLRYDPEFSDRVVWLEGEGFFDVTHQAGATFSIRSGEAVTTVLGTSFNVRAYPEEKKISVSVVTGKVQLANAVDTKEAVVLQAGQSASLDEAKKSPEIDEEPAVNAPSWHTQVLRFDDELMLEVVQALEMQFGKEIRLDNPAIGNCHYTGNFKTNDLTEIMNALSFALRLEMETRGDSIVLSGEGCNQ